MQNSRRWLLSAVLCAIVLVAPATAQECGSCLKDSCLSCGPADGLSADPFHLPFCERPACCLGTFSLDVVGLERSGGESQDILFANGNAVGNVTDLNFVAEAGLRLDLILPSDCGCDLNVNVFGTGHDRATFTRSDPNITFQFFGASPATPAASYTLEYESDLSSVEVNVRTREWFRLSPLAGLRYVNLDEEFNIWETGSTTGFFSEVDNRLYGVQAGAQAQLWRCGRWRLESTGKAGVYYNDLNVRAVASDPAGNSLVLQRTHLHTSFVGEVQLTVIYQVGRRLRLRTGYQGLWLSGVALAPDQSDNGLFGTGLMALDAGKVSYQGGFAGLEITW